MNLDIIELKMTDYTDSDVVYAEGGNKQNSILPMVFSIHGDFTINEEYEVGNQVRLKADGFDEEVKLLAMSKEKITIAAKREIGIKLMAAGKSE